MRGFFLVMIGAPSHPYQLSILTPFSNCSTLCFFALPPRSLPLAQNGQAVYYKRSAGLGGGSLGSATLCPWIKHLSFSMGFNCLTLKRIDLIDINARTLSNFLLNV